MIIGCVFYVPDEDRKILFCSGFCENEEMCSQRLHITEPFDVSGYRCTAFDESEEDGTYDAVLRNPGCTWYRALWSTRGMYDRKVIVAVKEL